MVLAIIWLSLAQEPLLRGQPTGKVSLSESVVRERKWLKNRGVLLSGSDSDLSIPASLDNAVELVRMSYPDPTTAKAMVSQMARGLESSLITYPDGAWVWHRAWAQIAPAAKGEGRVSTRDPRHFEFLHAGFQNTYYQQFGSPKSFFGQGVYAAQCPYCSEEFGDYLIGIQLPKGTRILENFDGKLWVPQVGVCKGEETLYQLFSGPFQGPLECRKLVIAALQALGAIGLRFQWSAMNADAAVHRWQKTPCPRKTDPNQRSKGFGSALIFFGAEKIITPRNVIGLVPGRTHVHTRDRQLLKGMSVAFPELIGDYKLNLSKGTPAHHQVAVSQVLGCARESTPKPFTLVLEQSAQEVCQRVLPGAAGKSTIDLIQQWNGLYDVAP